MPFSRRLLLLGAICSPSCTTAARAQAALRCDDLTAPPKLALTEAEQERHAIYLLLAMSLTFDAWGIDRERPDLLATYRAEAPGRTFPDYAGHNIGAVLVDPSGGVICAALNRNVQLNSTLEHAEARTVRQAIDHANAQAGPGGPQRWSFGSLLNGTRLYSTLEPCPQCAGIMDLANIQAVVYAQDDPSQHNILNVLHNLQAQPGSAAAPLPVRADFLPLWGRLSAEYDRFVAGAGPGARTGLTAFLETVGAWRVFRDASAAFDAMQPRYPANCPSFHGARAFRERSHEALLATGLSD